MFGKATTLGACIAQFPGFKTYEGKSNLCHLQVEAKICHNSTAEKISGGLPEKWQHFGNERHAIHGKDFVTIQENL